MRWQTGAAVAPLVALAIVAVVAFGGGSGPPQVGATSMERSGPVGAPSPSSAPSRTPPVRPSPEPVLPGNDVDDPLEAIAAIEAYRDWLFANPDPDLVRFIYHPECSCTEPFREALSALETDGKALRLESGTSVANPELVRADAPGVVIVEYDIAVAALRLVDRDGTVVSRRAAAERRRVRTSLVRAGGGRWLVTSVEEPP